MPLLEELSLSVEFSDFELELPDDPDALDLQLIHLKYFYLDAMSSDCAELLPWFTFNPGCVFSIRCTDSGIDEDHAAVREFMSYYATETKLDMTDKILTVNVLHGAISLLVSSTSPSSDTADSQVLFRFLTVLQGHDEFDHDERQGNAMFYGMFSLLLRTAHLMKLTKCPELHLNVESASLIADCIASFFAALVCACKNAKTLVLKTPALKGTKNGYINSLILNKVTGTGGYFNNEDLFSDIDALYAQEGTGDEQEELAEWKLSDFLTGISNNSVITTGTREMSL